MQKKAYKYLKMEFTQILKYTPLPFFTLNFRQKGKKLKKE